MRPTRRDLYALLASHNVRYIVIGGVAVIAHGVPRFTLDLDIVIEATRDNATRLVAALREARLGTAFEIEPADVLAQEIILFRDWLALDVHTKPPGFDFETAWVRRRIETVDGVPVNILSIEDLIASKEATGRPVDLEDVVHLREVLRQDDPADGPASPS